MNKKRVSSNCYAAHIAIMDLKRNWKLNIVIAACLALGMLLPLLCLGNVNVFIHKFSTIHLKDEANTLKVSFHEGYATPCAMKSALNEYEVPVDEFTATAISRSYVEYNGISNSLNIYHVIENYLDFETVQLMEGSLDIFGSERLCLVDISMQNLYPDLCVGDTITISGKQFTVGGIFTALNKKSIVVPIRNAEWDTSTGLSVDCVYLRSPAGLPDKNQVMMALQSIGLSNFILQDGKQVFMDTLGVCIQKAAVVITIGLAAFCFSAINISLILMGKLMQDKRSIGIKMAIGASSKLIVMENLTENLLCYCIAFLMDFGLVWAIYPTCPKELELVIDGKVYVAAFLFGITMVIAITYISTQWVKKQNLVTLIERVS